MKSLRWFLACFLCSFIVLQPRALAAGIDWQPWSDGLFEKAKAEHKFVLLDLGAVWCHWCHVMDEVTYGDPEVIRLLGSSYIALRLDQDARPDLSNRYADYGWPATVIFKADGSELVKRQGYIPPRPMASLLQAVIDDPTPGPSVRPEPELVAATDAALGSARAAAAREVFIKAYDTVHGGWGEVHHYLDWNALEYCLAEAAGGDKAMAGRARQTLASGLKLVDPVWGGVYQYSTDGDWDHPHFEKIMPFQAENLRIFALAAQVWREPRWLEPARRIRGYLKAFLTSPEGAFYTSQDADVVRGEHSAGYFALDDAGRRKQGMPAVDKHVYARENGLAIMGLAALYAASGEESCLADALKAAEWTLQHRQAGERGFRHDEKDAAGPYLADTLAMGRAFLALYSVTGETAWLRRAGAAAEFMNGKFRAPAGFATATAVPPFKPKPQVDENLALARLCNMLYHCTGKEEFKGMAAHAMRLLVSPTVVDGMGHSTAGLLLADGEMRREPAHLTVVGAKDSPAAKALFLAVLKGAPAYARIEWIDAKKEPPARDDVAYPTLPEPAAFVCASGVCSAPLRTVEQVIKRLEKTDAKAK